jgi:hypothetical protein
MNGRKELHHRGTEITEKYARLWVGLTVEWIVGRDSYFGRSLRDLRDSVVKDFFAAVIR